MQNELAEHQTKFVLKSNLNRNSLPFLAVEDNLQIDSQLERGGGSGVDITVSDDFKGAFSGRNLELRP